MPNEPNHECIICGRPFFSCNNCVKISDFDNFDKNYIEKYCLDNNIQEPLKSTMFLGYKSVADTVNHYLVYCLIMQIRRNEISKSEIKSTLLDYGITTDEIQTFKPSVRDFLMEYIDEEVAEIIPTQEYSNKEKPLFDSVKKNKR